MAKLARRLRVSWVLIAVLLMLPLLAAIPLDRAAASPSSTAPAAPAAPASYVFEGGGWGHAVGLSQWGAYGQARLDGASYRDILGHYYTGSSTSELGKRAVSVGPLWVNVERDISAVTLRNRTIHSGGVAADVSRRGPDTEVAPHDALTVEVVGTRADGSPRCKFETSDGFTDRGPCRLDLAWDGDTADPTTRFVIESVQRGDEAQPCLLPDWNAVPTRFRECAYSRGQLHIRPDNDSQTFHLVLEIDINDYVLGISEMPYYWSLPVDGPNGLEALKAQAVAARSYAARRAIDRGDPASRTFCWCHVHDTTVDQRYVGWGHSGLGQAGWIDAVTATRNVVATHPAITREGKRLPILAFYSSSSYGQTEPSEVGFGSPAVYLKSVDDRWALDASIRNPQATWSKALSGREIATALGWAKKRDLAAVDIVACSPSGAASELRFTDTDGETETRPTRNLRTTLGLRSPQIASVNGIAPCRGNGDATFDVVAGALTIDDDAAGDSIGNGDGLAQCGETVELRTALVNAGNEALGGVVANIRMKSTEVSILHNTSSTFPRLNVIGNGVNDNDWDISIDAEAAGVAVLKLDVTADTGGPWVIRFELPFGCGDTAPPNGTITIASHRVDDGAGGDSIGNSDGSAQCGETIELFLALRNEGDRRLRSPVATLEIDAAQGTILHNAASVYPTLEAGAAGENANDWDIAIAESASRLTGMLHVTAENGGPWELPLSLQVGCGDAGQPSPKLVVGKVVVDDGLIGDSVGNGDGVAQCGETVELHVTLRNTGDRAANGLTGRFIVKDDHLTLLHNAEAGYPDLAPGKRGKNDNDFDLLIAPDTPRNHDASFRMRVEDGAGNVYRANGTLPITCNDRSPVRAGAVTVDDGVLGDSIGNNDGVAQCGERIELYVELQNRSGGRLNGVTARLRSLGPHLDLLYNRNSSYPALRPGDSADNENDWDVDVAANAPDGKRLELELVVKDGGGRWIVPFPLQLECG